MYSNLKEAKWYKTSGLQRKDFPLKIVHLQNNTTTKQKLKRIILERKNNNKVSCLNQNKKNSLCICRHKKTKNLANTMLLWQIWELNWKNRQYFWRTWRKSKWAFLDSVAQILDLSMVKRKKEDQGVNRQKKRVKRRRRTCSWIQELTKWDKLQLRKTSNKW